MIKYKIILFITGLILSGTVLCQTYRPSCYSNAAGWQIESIDNADYSTDVHLSYYSYQSSYTFFFAAGTYIENYSSSSSKYYLNSADYYSLNTEYTLRPYTRYEFTLHFEKIPSYWTDINIREPRQENNYTTWYWDYITLNSSARLKTDNFFLGKGFGFLKSFVHPTNNLQQYRYNVDYDGIRCVMYYEGYVTDLKLTLRDDMVTNVEVLYDNDWIQPFSVLSLIRDFIYNNDSGGYQSRFERILGKLISNMSGTELACIGLTILKNL